MKDNEGCHGGVKDNEGCHMANEGQPFIKCKADAKDNNWGTNARCRCVSASSKVTRAGDTNMDLWEAAGKPLFP